MTNLPIVGLPGRPITHDIRRDGVVCCYATSLEAAITAVSAASPKNYYTYEIFRTGTNSQREFAMCHGDRLTDRIIVMGSKIC